MVNKVANLLCTAFLAEQIQNLKIAVIGDVMLDRYFYGEVKRISPEAPVPVNKVKRIKSVLGGAANVAANLAHLECRVFMGGVTGADISRRVCRFGMRSQAPSSRCCAWILKKQEICFRKKQRPYHYGFRIYWKPDWTV